MKTDQLTYNERLRLNKEKEKPVEEVQEFEPQKNFMQRFFSWF